MLPELRQWTSPVGIVRFACWDLFPDPCEYDNIAGSHLPVVRKLLQRLITYQKKARPLWFPERDPSANPADFDGYWTFWRNSTANKFILKKAADSIPVVRWQSDCCHGNETAHGLTAGRAEHAHGHLRHPGPDKNIYNVLNRILKQSDLSRKHKLPLRHRMKIRKALSKLFWVMALKAGEKVISRRRHRLRESQELPRKHGRIPGKLQTPVVKAPKANDASKMALYTILKAAGDLTGANIAKKDRIEQKESGDNASVVNASQQDEVELEPQQANSFDSQPSGAHISNNSDEEMDERNKDDVDYDDNSQPEDSNEE